MFSRRTNTSKVAFVSLAQQLNLWGYRLLDCQMPSNHLFSLGAQEIPRIEFEALLNEGYSMKVEPKNWRETWAIDS